MSNFHATNLDLAYTNAKAFYNLVTNQGVTLASNLESNIRNLISHWRGSDATLHINNLISVYNSLCTLITDVSIVAHNVSIPIVEAQTIRNANGGAGNVDTVITEYTMSAAAFDAPGDTSEYYVDTTEAPKDYTTLVEICDEFQRFQNTFGTIKENFLTVWVEGSDRAAAVSTIEEFEGNATSYYKIIQDAANNLGTATGNFAGL